MKTPQRRALLTAALGFRAIEWRYRPDPAGALEKYLDSGTVCEASRHRFFSTVEGLGGSSTSTFVNFPG